MRLLVENPWQGGGGYTWEQVGDMTLDQIWARLCDITILKREKGQRVRKEAPLHGTKLQSKDGVVTGRDRHGNLIKGRIGGKSKARMLMEQQEAQTLAAEEAKARATRAELRRRRVEKRRRRRDGS